MEKSEKLTLDAKQRHLAKLKKKLAKHERKLERSLRVSQAKEHVRKKLKEQAQIEAAENQSLMIENLSFDSGDDQSFNNSCLSPFVSKDSDVTVVDVTVVDLTTGDITLSDINQGDRTPLNATSGTTTPQKSKELASCVKDGSSKRKIKSKDNEEKSRNSSPSIGIPIQMIESEKDHEKLKDTSLAKGTPIQRRPTSVVVKDDSRPTTVDKKSPTIECSVSEVAVTQDSPKLKVLDETTNQRQRKDCSDVPKISKKMQSPSNRANFLNAKNASFSNELPSPMKVVTPKHQTLLSSNHMRSSTNQKPSPTNQKFSTSYTASTNEKPSPGHHKTPSKQKSSSNQKPSPSNQKSFTNHMTSTNPKPSSGNHKTQTNQKYSSSHMTSTNEKQSRGNHKTTNLQTNPKQKPSSNQKSSTDQKTSHVNQTSSAINQKSPHVNQIPSVTNQRTSPPNQKTSPNQTLSATNQKTSSSNQKTSPSNQKSHLDDSGISQSSLEISRTSFLNDSLSLTPTFGDDEAVRSRSRRQVDKPHSENKLQDPKQKLHFIASEINFSVLETCDDGSQKSRRKVDHPQFENELQDLKKTLRFKASEIDFSCLESSDPLERGQKKNSSKSFHEVSNFDTIEFISQTKSASKPKVNVRDHQPIVNLQQQTSRRKLKEVEQFVSASENSFEARSKRESESLAIPDNKAAATNDFNSNSEKIAENLFPKDEDVQIFSQEELNFGSMEGMDPDLPILIIDRKSKRRSRSKHKSSRQTSSPILSQKEDTTSIKISGTIPKPGGDTRNSSSRIDSAQTQSSKVSEMEMLADTIDPELTKHKRSGIQGETIDLEPTKNNMEKQTDSHWTENRRTERQSGRKERYIDGDITEVSESDSQRSVSILVDTSKSFNTQQSASILVDTSKSLSLSCVLDEKISVIESEDDEVTITSPKSDDHSSQSLLKSSKKHSPKDCVGANDCKRKLARNSTACENMDEDSCSIVPTCKPGSAYSSSQEKHSSQNSQLSDSLSFKRKKFKQRKRSLSHGQDGSESLGSSQDSKRIKVSETSQDSSSMNSGAESTSDKLSSKSTRKGTKNNARTSQESNKCKTLEKQEAANSNSQNSSLSSNSKASRQHQLLIATKNVTLDSKDTSKNTSSNSKISKHPEMSTATKNVTMDSKLNSEMSQYSEFTELDVVEFSQFKFSEEFLTEGSENSERGRKRKRHPSHLGMIVQRRSPRVASLVDSESSSNSCSDNTRHRRTKKEKCLIISSVFQYLIDETKRKSEIEEFKLPDSQFKDLVDVKLLENNFELDDNTTVISAAKNALCAERQKSPINSPKYNYSDSLNLENRDITSCETRDILKCDKCNSSKIDKFDNGPCNKCDVRTSVKNSDNDYSASDVQSSKIFLNSEESKDTNAEKKMSENRTQSQNSQKLKQACQTSASSTNKNPIQNLKRCSQSSVSDPKILEVEKSKQKTKVKDSERNVNLMSDINVIYDSDENFMDSDEESTSSKARHETMTTDLENDIKVIYESEPLPDDSMSEEKCYHRNDATDLQENDLSTISEKSMKDNSAISDHFEEKENKNFEDIAKRTENNEQERFTAKNLESAVKRDKSESPKILEFCTLQPEQVKSLDENLDDSEVTFKNNIQLPISTPKFSSKIKRGQSKNLFRNSTSTPKCVNLTQTPKTPNVDEIKSSTPKINAKFVDSVSNVESFETPKAEQPKFAENMDSYTTPKDANIRRHFNFADDNLSPPLFPTQKDLTPIGMRRLEDETLDSFIQLDDEETECDDLIGPTDCIKLCREESVVFISGGTWTSDGLEYSYIVCLLPSAISVWSQGQGQWENELDWYLSQTYQAIEGWIIKKPNKVVLIILEEDKTGEQRVSLFYYDLLSGDSNMTVIDLHITQSNPVTSLLCCIINEDQLIIGYNHCTSLTATKHLLIDGYKQMSLCCHLESTSGYLMDLAEVRHLECCVVGLTSKREALIWNHEAGFLIKKINLESVITPGVSLTAVHNIQGYLVCHLLYRVKSDSPGYVVIVNIANSSSLILHDYPSLQYSWKGLKNAAISGDSLLASDIQGNIGFWDMVSGELLADIPRSKVTSGNINQSDETLYLGMDRGAVHVYPMESINLKS